MIGLPLYAGEAYLSNPPPPDVQVEAYELGWASIRGASIRGEAKRLSAEPRQDALRIARIQGQDGDLVVIVLADGLGSCDLSHRGAELACIGAIKALSTAGDLQSLNGTKVIDAAVSEIHTWASNARLDAKRLSTTLQVVVVKQSDDGADVWQVAVGDGRTYLIQDGTASDIDEPHATSEDSFVASNETAALPNNLGVPRVARARVRRGQALASGTDGARPLLELEGVRDHYLQLFAGPVPIPSAFLWHADSRIRSYDDDRTLVVLSVHV